MAQPSFPTFWRSNLITALLFFCILCHTAKASGEWVRRYSGPSGDTANAIGVDGRGNVYVTGFSTLDFNKSDYATIKYDANGSQKWVIRYNGFGMNIANAIAVDSCGNVHVTGKSWGYGPNSNYDYATIKYDTNGNQQWVRRYNGPAKYADGAIGIALDGRGNVYVTGSSYGVASKLDYATIKYDTNGNPQWVRRYNGPANNADEAVALAVDFEGNVYVTGNSEAKNPNYNYDYATIKYDTNGNRKWVKRYNANILSNSEHSHEEAKSIAVDSSGNVYVTGRSMIMIPMSRSINKYATIKYDTNGKPIWVKQFETRSSANTPKAIGVDRSGSVYVTGNFSVGNELYPDYLIIKYDKDGHEGWTRLYNGPVNGSDVPSAMAVDRAANVYVTGRSFGYGYNDDYATVKYDTKGNRIWVRRYEGPGDPPNYGDQANALAVDRSGNVFVTGFSVGTGTSSDYATVKYGVDGN